MLIAGVTAPMWTTIWRPKTKLPPWGSTHPTRTAPGMCVPDLSSSLRRPPPTRAAQRSHRRLPHRAQSRHRIHFNLLPLLGGRVAVRAQPGRTARRGTPRPCRRVEAMTHPTRGYHHNIPHDRGSSLPSREARNEFLHRWVCQFSHDNEPLPPAACD